MEPAAAHSPVVTDTPVGKYWRLKLFATTAVALLATWPLFALCGHQPRWQPFCRRVRRWGSNSVMAVNGLPVTLTPLADVDWQRPYVICPNHASYLDMSALMRALPCDPVFLSKTDVANMPLIGVYSRTVDIPVSREYPRQAMGALERALGALGAGESVVVFPEGAFAGPPEKTSHFFNGAFKLAIKAGVPVLPLTLINTWNSLPDGIDAGSPGPVEVIVHAPISTEGLSVRHRWGTTDDVLQLRDKVRDVVQKGLDMRCGGAAYVNRWTGQPLGPESIPEYTRITPYLKALLAGRVR